jgi:hypothetical protein
LVKDWQAILADGSGSPSISSSTQRSLALTADDSHGDLESHDSKISALGLIARVSTPQSHRTATPVFFFLMCVLI